MSFASRALPLPPANLLAGNAMDVRLLLSGMTDTLYRCMGVCANPLILAMAIISALNDAAAAYSNFMAGQRLLLK